MEITLKQAYDIFIADRETHTTKKILRTFLSIVRNVSINHMTRSVARKLQKNYSRIT